MPAAPVMAMSRSNRPLSPFAPWVSASQMARTITSAAYQRTGRTHACQDGSRFIAAARTNPAATNTTTPSVLRVLSIVPPALATWLAGVQPGRRAGRRAARSP